MSVEIAFSYIFFHYLLSECSIGLVQLLLKHENAQFGITDATTLCMQKAKQAKPKNGNW